MSDTSDARIPQKTCTLQHQQLDITLLNSADAFSWIAAN